MPEAPEGRDFEADYRRLYPYVTRTAYLVVLDWATAQEISQEAFGRLWQHRNDLDSTGDPKPWLLRVAVNLAIDYRRSLLSAVRQRLLPEAPRDPGELAITRLEVQDMRAALLRLPARDRAVLVLRFEHGLSFPEIGSVFDKPEATVKTWVHRALGRLRRDLGLDNDPVQLAEGNS